MWWVDAVNANNAGTVVCQHHASERTRRKAGEFEDVDTIKSRHCNILLPALSMRKSVVSGYVLVMWDNRTKTSLSVDRMYLGILKK